MRGDEEISRANCEPSSDLAINFEAGLFRIRNRTMPVGITVTHRRRSCRSGRHTVGEDLTGGEKILGELCGRRHAGYRYVGILIQLVDRALGASSIWGQIRIDENRRTLRICDEEKRHG